MASPGIERTLHEGPLDLTPELFVVPDSVSPLLYAPVKGRVYRVSTEMAERVQTAKASPHPVSDTDPPLAQAAFALGLTDPIDRPTVMPSRPRIAPFKPTGAIILVTTRCNLRCRYCYASAGEHVQEAFRQDVAEAAIRLIVRNAVELGEENIYLNFHGGGEPTLDMPLIRHCVEYARAVSQEQSGGSIRVISGMVTNGYASEASVEWIAKNMDSVQVSLDGPSAIHDQQRPLQNGAGSSQRVMATINTLAGRVPDLMIKATVSANSVAQMGEIAEFLCTNFDIPRFHLGPVLSEGRGRSRAFGQPDGEDFFRGYLAAESVANQHGKTIVVSGAQAAFPALRTTYCGVTDPNFAVNVNGSVTSCYEVIYEDDPKAHEYHYGRFDPQRGEFVFDQERIAALQTSDVNAFEKCRDCFAKYHCAGDCRARWHPGQSDLEDIRCEVSRRLIERELRKLVSEV